MKLLAVVDYQFTAPIEVSDDLKEGTEEFENAVREAVNNACEPLLDAVSDLLQNEDLKIDLEWVQSTAFKAAEDWTEDNQTYEEEVYSES
jgi:hypothetical protein